jgi:Cys-tRNA(Pro) deacylase
VAREAYPVTPAVRALRAQGVAFTPHLYAYEARGGTRHSAAELAVDEHLVIKTLVMEDDAQRPFLILMHGDREVSTRQLARALGARSVVPAAEATARRATGYELGGTSPFGTRTTLPVYAERSIFALPRVLINGGKRGFLVEIDPRDLKRVVPVVEVEVAVEGN